MAYDLKYGKVVAQHGEVTHGVGGIPLNVSDEPVFIIRAQDKAAVEAVRKYREEAEKIGASRETLDAIDWAANHMDVWQKAHPGRVKVPD